MTRPQYGEDAEYDAYIERQIDPAYGARDDYDPLGWRADREQERWERDRGSVALPYLGFVLLFAPMVWAIYTGQIGWAGLGLVACLAFVAVACCVQAGRVRGAGR